MPSSCSNCGASVASDDRFCEACGASLTTAPAATTQVEKSAETPAPAPVAPDQWPPPDASGAKQNGEGTMDERAASVRQRVDAKGGIWTGHLAEVLRELGYSDIDPSIGVAVKSRLAAGGMAISPDLSKPGLVPGRWVRIRATGDAPSEVTPWPLPSTADSSPAPGPTKPAEPPAAPPPAPPPPQPAMGAPAAAEPPQPVSDLSWLAIILLGILGAVSLWIIGAGANYESKLSNLEDSFGFGEVYAASQVIDAQDSFTTAFIVGFVVYAVSSLAFLPWFYRAYRNLQRAGANLRFSTGWAIGAWFVPILSLWRPKQIANDIWRGATLDPGLRDTRWLQRPVSPIVHWWWALFLGYGFASGIAWTVLDSNEEGLTTSSGISTEQTGVALLILAGVVGIAGIIVAILMVRRIAQIHDAAINPAGSTTSVPFAPPAPDTAIPATPPSTPTPPVSVPAASTESSRFCGFCGAALSPGHRYCTGCGNEISG